MLVLSRTSGQTVVIGDNVRVTLVEVARGRVRLAIDAPPHVTIRRGELAALGGQGGSATDAEGE